MLNSLCATDLHYQGPIVTHPTCLEARIVTLLFFTIVAIKPTGEVTTLPLAISVTTHGTETRTEVECAGDTPGHVQGHPHVARGTTHPHIHLDHIVTH